MNRHHTLPICAVTLSIVFTALLGASTFAAEDDTSYSPRASPTVYVESNSTKKNQNSVLAYGISDDGSLHQLRGSPFHTDGTGYYDPSFALGPFDNDQQLTLGQDGQTLYAVNAGSNSITALHIARDGGLSGLLGWPTASHGSTPISIGRQGNSIVVINSSEDPVQAATAGLPNSQVIDILPGGYPRYRPLSGIELPKGSDPTQALTQGTGPFLFGTSFPAGGSIAAFMRRQDGSITPTDDILPPVVGGTQALALGLWAHPQLHYLYAGLVNVNRIGVYQWNEQGHLKFIETALDSGQGPCWLRVTKDGHFLLASNTADQSVSVFSLTDPAHPVEVLRAADGGLGGYFELSLSPDERHLYVLEQQDSQASVGRSNKIHVFDFDRSSGSLTAVPSKLVTLPVDASTRPVGLIVR